MAMIEDEHFVTASKIEHIFLTQSHSKYLKSAQPPMNRYSIQHTYYFLKLSLKLGL